MRCPRCLYEWAPRVPNPKACPRCKGRLDYTAGAAMGDPLALSISRAKSLGRGYEKTLTVVAALTESMGREGVSVVIIGGSAVEFYTRNWYATGDVDLAVDESGKEAFREVLEKAGFEPAGRMWVREDLDLYIEMPGNLRDLALDKVTAVETEGGTAYVAGIEDMIFDRVQAAQHWDSTSDEEQAVRMATVYFDDIDWTYLEGKCAEERSLDMLQEVRRRAEDERSQAG